MSKKKTINTAKEAVEVAKGLIIDKHLKDAGQILGYDLADHIIFDSGRKYKSII